ncbi:hypothetical protein X743_31185 [Mesorhizobium sp. LNHC252B00]|nr:hypothetical protein X743_31185 [Mesorhizobium sp. LNHC252B00]
MWRLIQAGLVAACVMCPKHTLAEAPGRLVALIEVKATSKIDSSDFRHINWFDAARTIFAGWLQQPSDFYPKLSEATIIVFSLFPSSKNAPHCVRTRACSTVAVRA